MSACQDRKVTKDIWLSWLVCILTCTPIFVVRYPRLMGLPQIRIYDTSKMGFKLVQTIEAQVNAHILSYLIFTPHILSSGCWLECIRCCLKSWRRSFGLLIMVWQPSPGARNDDIFFWSKLSPSNPWWSYFDQNDHPSKWSKLQNIKCFTQMTRIEMVQTNIWTIW